MFGWMIFAVICAYIVKGMCGFANTLIFSTILSFKTTNINISPIELFLGLPSNIIMAVKERRNIKFKLWFPVVVLVILGAIPGVYLLKNVNGKAVKIFFGIVIVMIGVELFIRECSDKKGKASKVILAIIGIVSGILSGMFGIGALLAAYMGKTTDTNSEFRGNLCVVFAVDNLFRMLLYFASGIITLDIIIQSVKLMPFMLIGFGLGIILSRKIDEKKVKKVIILMLILSGISLLVLNLI